MPRLRELSRLFSQFRSNHAQFISLFAQAFRGSMTEGQLYQSGRQRILAVNQAIEELAAAAEGVGDVAELLRTVSALLPPTR
ncbi:MAG TPA: hypothetical protein VFK10_01915 [Burkholderiaceae bacterium]|nr:hypothetical protein [Burkholderiaceae bacterium]